MSTDRPFQQEFLGTFPSSWGRLAVCKHCRFNPRHHMDDGKCPFEATYFEPVRIPMKEADNTSGMDPG
jgi:hypothetical protein